jgi:CBS domain-containing protein
LKSKDNLRKDSDESSTDSVTIKESLSNDYYDENDLDEDIYPMSEAMITWEHLNVDFKSSTKEYKDIIHSCEQNTCRMIDLRPYMIEEVYTVSTKDKLGKILTLFRYMHLRHLPVVHERTGKLEGIITRQDIFSYMSL